MLCKTCLHTLVFEDASSPLVLTYCIAELIFFAFSDNLSAENSKLSADSGLQRIQLLECMVFRWWYFTWTVASKVVSMSPSFILRFAFSVILATSSSLMTFKWDVVGINSNTAWIICHNNIYSFCRISPSSMAFFSSIMWGVPENVEQLLKIRFLISCHS